MNAFLDAWTTGSILSALIGGVFGGLFLQTFHPHGGLRLVLLQAWVVGWLGVLFYVGRIAEAFVRADAVGFTLGSFGLWMLFSAALGLGAYASQRAREEWDRREQRREQDQEEDDCDHGPHDGPCDGPAQ